MSEMIADNHLLITKDGSHTVLHPYFHQHYHSLHGAIQESEHVFIAAGLKAIPNKEISILEIGFGTALNGFLTAQYARKNSLKIQYTALEPFPLDLNIVHKLNYTQNLNKLQYQEEFLSMHSSKMDQWIEINENFKLMKMQQKIETVGLNGKFNMVYFDAFAPSAQPEMWVLEVFTKLFNLMLPGGILTSYCAKGEFKRTLKKAGFIVETLPGPPGKREMVRAIKP
ncbi:MAG: tRNA (5-methylaminomethyl-2-thiouridine)(34)-methyltransferase MnmD [Bacteroidota bacterium]|nr:tRNA (5-methylaminomethyl-2-thiouridine)(34)-methyltransferase MnmD [Bacteroidota bacterium]